MSQLCGTQEIALCVHAASVFISMQVTRQVFQSCFNRAEVRSIVSEWFLLRYKEQAKAVTMRIVRAANMAVHVGCVQFAQFSCASDQCFVMVAVQVDCVHFQFVQKLRVQ